MVKVGTRERIPHRTYDPTMASCRVPIGWARNVNDLPVGNASMYEYLPHAEFGYIVLFDIFQVDIATELFDGLVTLLCMTYVLNVRKRFLFI